MAYYQPGSKRWANSTLRDIKSLSFRAYEFVTRAIELRTGGDLIGAAHWKHRADIINAEVQRDLESLERHGFIAEAAKARGQ